MAEGSPKSLGGRNAGVTLIRFHAPADGPGLPDLAGLSVRDGTAEVRTETPTATLHQLTGWALDRGVELEGLAVTRPTLEDVYLELTGSAETQDGEEPVAVAGGRRGRRRR